ncbi:MAG: hypothetical protein WCT14_07700 [Treponemataceae bacterium]
MKPARFAFLIPLFLFAFSAGTQETLRGMFEVDLEPVSAMESGVPYPLDQESAHRRVLDEAVRVFAAMIYGWKFEYAIGDRSRSIPEHFDFEELGSIPSGDPRLTVTDAEREPSTLRMWAEYRLNEAQTRAFTVGREGAARYSQGTGSGPLSGGPVGKAAALKDAARAAVRLVLGGTERNRPKEAFGTVVLMEVPRYWVDAGQYQCAARFRVTVKEIVPYRFY